MSESVCLFVQEDVWARGEGSGVRVRVSVGAGAHSAWEKEK